MPIYDERQQSLQQVLTAIPCLMFRCLFQIMKPATTGHEDCFVPNGVLRKDEESEPMEDQGDGPKNCEREDLELRNGEEGGEKPHWGKALWKGPRQWTRTRCEGQRSPAIPEGIIDKPESPDGRFRCDFCKKSLGCRTIKDLRGHVVSKKHRKAMARRQEFDTDTVECMEDTTPATQGKGEDTTQATQVNVEDTTRGNAEDTTQAT